MVDTKKFNQSAKQSNHDADSKQQVGCVQDRGSLCNVDEKDLSKSSVPLFRYFVVVMCGWAMGTMLILRVTIGVAMISMVNHTALYINEHPNYTEHDLERFFPPDYVETGDFEWTNEVQQTIISGYMLAYTIPQYFFTRMTMRYTMKLGIPVCLAVCSISNILLPTMSYWGWPAALFLRLLNGAGASAVLPCMIAVIESWLPTKETGNGIALFQFVDCILYALTPLISGYFTSFHWKWAFYVSAMHGLVFSVFWYFMIDDKPDISKYLSKRELNYIKTADQMDKKGFVAKVDDKKVDKKDQKFELPWYFMFRHKEYYFLCIIWICQCSTISGFLFLLPPYMNRVLKLPVEQIGNVNFYVQIGTIFSSLWPHPLSNFMQSKFNLSLTTTRIINVFITEFFTGITYAYLAVFHDDLIITIFINRFFSMTYDTIHVATLMSMFGHAGVSGLVYSMVNTIGNLSTVFFCWAMGRFLDYTGETLTCWSWIFVILSSLNTLLFLVYTITCPSIPIKLVKEPEGQNQKDAVTA